MYKLFFIITLFISNLAYASTYYIVCDDNTSIKIKSKTISIKLPKDDDYKDLTEEVTKWNDEIIIIDEKTTSLRWRCNDGGLVCDSREQTFYSTPSTKRTIIDRVSGTFKSPEYLYTAKCKVQKKTLF